MGFFTKKSSSRAAVVYDISDNSVAAAFVATDKKLPEIFWSRRYPVVVNKDHGHNSYTRALRRALEVLQRDVLKTGLPLLNRLGIETDSLTVKCVLSSGWHTADTITSRLHTGEAFIPGTHHIEKAQQQAHDDFVSRYGDAFYGDDPAHLSHRLLGIHGDGQPAMLSRKRPVEKLDVHMYISKAPQMVQQILESQLGQTFNRESIDYHSGYETVNDALMGADRSLRDFLVILPSRRKTDVLHTAGGTIRGISSSPLGEDFMIRTISKAFNRPVSDIRSRIELHRQQRHHPDSAQEMDIALSEISRRWTESVYESMRAASNGSLPQQAYLMLPATKTSIVFADFASRLLDKAPSLEVFLINQERFSDYVQNYNKSDHTLTVSVLGSCGY
ncbi:MAG: hypothetical protein WD335_02025 [Candidatus Paceibacterota bacterium]